MESTKVNTLNQKNNQTNTNGNQDNNPNNEELNNNNVSQSDSYQNNQYYNQENAFQEQEQSAENYNSSHQNYIYQNQQQTPESPKESHTSQTTEANKDKEIKVNANAYPGDKPWNRAAKDPTLIQKGTELFVGNLSMDTIEEDLYESFQECGDIIDVNNIFLFSNLNFLLDYF